MVQVLVFRFGCVSVDAVDLFLFLTIRKMKVMSQVLTRASRELFTRGHDEVFHNMQDLFDHCSREREQSVDRWEMPRRLQPLGCPDGLLLNLADEGAFQMNDWSFGQLCRLAKVNRETVNRVSADTATRIFQETRIPYITAQGIR